jgi:septal ring factor EnvC (AmiA/AmiB activator)
MENKFADCDQEKIRLSETIGRIEASLGETTIQLKGMESKNTALNDQIKELSANLRASESQAKRYFTHNQRLSEIAKTLVAQVEKEQMGSSVMVKEPLIQFKRVELENMLQEYLDGIDSAKIIQ